MVCTFVDDTTNVRCLVSKKLSVFAGESFHGTISGIYFAGQIPSAKAFPTTVVTETPVLSEALAPVLSEALGKTEILVLSQAAAMTGTPTPVATNTPDATEASTGCPAGQTLVYDFEWSGTAHSDGYIASSTTYYDADTFYAEYGSYYDSVSTAYNSENILYYTYHHQNTYTFTSSGSINPSQWDGYVQHMESLDYNVEKTGEHCE